MKWKETDELLIGTYAKAELAAPTASFDLDHTLIRPTGGRTFSKSSDDWELCEGVKSKLRQIARDGFSLVIVTNQKKLTEQDKVDVFKEKMKLFGDTIKKSFTVFAVKGVNKWRKPLPTLWTKIPCNKDSFYCGDAAGRPVGMGANGKADFSNTDLTFALNGRVSFVTPDKLFLGTEDNNEIMPEPIEKYPATVDLSNYLPDEPAVVLLIGFPGSGKSTLAARVCDNDPDWVRVNRDTLGTAAKCHKVAKTALQNGKGIIVDNTNSQRKMRKPYLELANEFGLETYAVVLNVDFEEAWHRNWIRMYLTGQKLIPKVVYFTYRKRYEPPGKIEFDHIVEINPGVDEDCNAFYLQTPDGE